jgi:hypothetical protein
MNFPAIPVFTSSFQKRVGILCFLFLICFLPSTPAEEFPRDMKAALNDLAYTIDTGLYKLTGWQVGGPLQHRNRYLSQHPTRDPLAVGGIMNHHQQSLLRIDLTQHQMHAVILALRHVIPNGNKRERL